VAETASVAVVGAGAAGLMAAIHAARAGAEPVVVVDGARTLGAKILISGGGRCNVTHDAVDEKAFSGSTPAAIRKVLRRYDVKDTVAFFAERGVTLKREETGKLFPTTDRARTVLDALLGAARDAGVEVVHPWRVAAVARAADGFALTAEDGRPLAARRVVLATGGRSIPKSGSDGAGYAIARALGHTVTDVIRPALVPLRLADGHVLRGLSGLSAPATVEVRSGTGRRLAAFTDSTLCTHFGLSGPSVLDVSRHLLVARVSDPAAALVVNWLPGMSAEDLDRRLRDMGAQTVLRLLQGQGQIPERLARALCAVAGVEPTTPGHRLTREGRIALARAATAMDAPVVGDAGYDFAEVTAGGVPLNELRLETMESRACPGLFLCGEICDVDGRIGGYNFQWAWASGYVAGTAAAAPA
jgi:predicted Rossmann fold flavoprotein